MYKTFKKIAILFEFTVHTGADELGISYGFSSAYNEVEIFAQLLASPL